MLMPPLHRRHEHAHATPLDPFLGSIFTLRPQKGVACTSQHDDMRAGAVAMSLFIFADRKFREMRAHRVVDEFKQRGAIVSSPLFIIDGLKAPEVGDEVGLPDSTSFNFGNIA